MSFRSVFVALTIAFARIQARFWKLRGKRTRKVNRDLAAGSMRRTFGRKLSSCSISFV